MCGIAGIIGLEDIQDPTLVLNRMVKKLDHRGPDAEGFAQFDNAAFGHQRLSIIDLKEASNQPLFSYDRNHVIVYNGELYNYKEIRAQLSDYPFQTDSDTEVILAAYLKWGEKCLQLFNGMFAFAIHDIREQITFIARDRVGIKPLYYLDNGRSFVFASELRSIISSGLTKPKLNEEGLLDYLMYQTVHNPDTILQEVKMLPAGHFVKVTDTEIKFQRYWVPWQKLHFDQEPDLIHSKIRKFFTQSVEKRLISDVSLGAFLSGGIDSSLVVAVMSQLMDQKVDSFNVSFDESEFSESKYARLVADKFGTNHHEILLKPDDFLESLPEALAAIDHPSGDGPNTWIVSREVRKQGVKVALSGLGGDELFAGYDLFRNIPDVAEREWMLSFPKGLRSLAAKGYELYKPGLPSQKIGQVITSDYFDLKHLYPIMRKVLLESQVEALLKRKASRQNSNFKIIEAWEEFQEFDQLPALSRISIAEMSTYMQNVLLRDTDQMSMAHALEVRVPFLDHELVEYMMHVPDSLKYPHSPKKLLVDSFSDLLPSEIVDRPKMGFTLPWSEWMKSSLKTFCEERIQQISDHNLFDANATLNLWNDFLNGKVSWSRVWPLIVLSDWMIRNEVE